MKIGAVLALMLIGLAGCGLGGMAIQTDGVTYELPVQKQIAPTPPSEVVASRPVGGTNVVTKEDLGFTFIGEFTKFNVRNGNLTVNGKGYGTVKTGDRVKIDKAGNVSVNGTPR